MQRHPTDGSERLGRGKTGGATEEGGGVGGGEQHGEEVGDGGGRWQGVREEAEKRGRVCKLHKG